VEEIQSAIQTANAELLHRSAHTFKGLVGNFNAKPLEQLSKAIELKGKQADFSGVEDLFAELLKLLGPLKLALEQYLKEKSIDSK
jgi:HPt (histidine-containing phosphotransfer) domain-containing protein